jgi:hypothetical protein
VPTDWRWIVCGLLPGSIEGDLLLLALSKDRNFGREMGVAKKKKKMPTVFEPVQTKTTESEGNS